MSATVEPGSGIAEGELSPDLTELLAVDGSCLKSALQGLKPEQRAQLKDKTAQMRTQVVAASDLIGGRRAKINHQISILQAQLDKIKAGTSEVADFFRLMQPAIVSCNEGQAAASQVKVLTDRALATANELLYQVNLAKIREGVLIEQAKQADSTLGVLDRLNLLLG